MRGLLRHLKERSRLTVVVAVVLPGVLATAVEYILTSGFSGGIPILAAAIGGIAAMAAMALIDTPEKPQSITLSIQKTDTSQGLEVFQSPLNSRFYSPRTPAELVESVENLTEFAAEEVSKRHKGQWLRVNGSVWDVKGRRDSMSMSIELTGSDVLAHLRFEGSHWRERLGSFNRGDQVLAEGKITRITGISSASLGSVTLEECELVS